MNRSRSATAPAHFRAFGIGYPSDSERCVSYQPESSLARNPVDSVVRTRCSKLPAWSTKHLLLRKRLAQSWYRSARRVAVRGSLWLPESTVMTQHKSVLPGTARASQLRQSDPVALAKSTAGRERRDLRRLAVGRRRVPRTGRARCHGQQHPAMAMLSIRCITIFLLSPHRQRWTPPQDPLHAIVPVHRTYHPSVRFKFHWHELKASPCLVTPPAFPRLTPASGPSTRPKRLEIVLIHVLVADVLDLETGVSDNLVSDDALPDDY